MGFCTHCNGITVFDVKIVVLKVETLLEIIVVVSHAEQMRRSECTIDSGTAAGRTIQSQYHACVQGTIAILWPRTGSDVSADLPASSLSLSQGVLCDGNRCCHGLCALACRDICECSA